MKKLAWIAWSVGSLFMVFVSPYLIIRCTGQTPAQSAATVSNVRETVCGFVELTAPSTPELEQVRALCKAGAELKPIAAAYAGCSADALPAPAKTTEPSDAAVITTDAMVREPWPDAGQ